MSLEQSILEVGKSPELAAAIRLLTETSDAGVPRHSPKACRLVGTAIVCRSYEPALYELCHLTRAAAALPGGFVAFYWTPGTLSEARFRSLFISPKIAAAGCFKLNSNGIDLIYSDKSFAVTFGRMPFLASLFEFLVTVLGFTKLSDLLEPLSNPALTSREVSAQANTLSRALYDWLKDHLPPMQTQRKFRALIEFLKERHDGDFSVGDIDDAAIFDFWQRALSTPALEDFKTYDSVFRAFARLRQAIDHAQALRSVAQAASIGSSREAGEIDPADVAAIVESVSEVANPFDQLTETPAARVKFFNTGERDTCRSLFEYGQLADALPLSFLRFEVFGGAQSRITGALRRGLKGATLTELIETSCMVDYLGYRKTLAALEKHGRDVVLASAHLLRISGVLPQQSELPPEHSISEAEAKGFFAEAQRSSQKISRQGFRPGDLADEEVRQGHVAGVPVVREITDRIAGFVERLGHLALDETFDQDRQVFTTCFRAIYGERA